MKISPLAGKLPPPSMLVNVPNLIKAYYTGIPDPSIPAQRVEFGTSGHRGSSLDKSFNENHILAISSSDLFIPNAAEDRWPLISWDGYACPFLASPKKRP